ncbi:proline--tRNA ligase [Cyanobium sp. Cruz CV13-4-11]|jgi:prolyl-tRNA synthetase|uniref:proline--tRNA ligase n=1 Tax=unclassified Cyanobium TaxID=2627006 RepID=UPI0020CF94C7|nr:MULTISPECIES: proline--tRNA ligase [unclassified Cyanobium]MCP9899929.1 proline--tRNA ligase [Cyanobium sp. Cruz CV11-17]MCP9918960.1 proline--tRNA ligase [Cyanobium sp. Cruz CV13-4-11]
MRVSRLMLVTLRDDPAEAEIISHKLLLRAGYMRRLAPGIFAYLPLLWRVLQKVSAIVREEMAAVDALETLLPQLQPADLWRRSGRWDGYTAGEGIMFHLVDRQERSLGLGPTHEEVVTELAADLLRSYRQLPVCLYQIQTKFRDEIRPRFGLMRGREFIMKDAYSFHADEACLRRTYAAMDGAYRRIFERCGLRAVAVEADSGAIGGSASQEFMVTAEAGEDLILASPDGRYAANQERAVSLPPAAVPLEAGVCRSLATPAQKSIEDLCTAHGFDPTQTLKVLLLLARFAAAPPRGVLVCLRGDQQLNDVKLANAVTARCPDAGALLEIVPLLADHLWDAVPFGFLGPHLEDPALRHGEAPGKAVPLLRLADSSAAELEAFVCGANRSDEHLVGARWGEICPVPEVEDLRSAQPGDRCLHDPSQRLEAARGIEVGHIFQLGRKYSEALEARFTNEAGNEEPLWMGCYGIGVSRLAQAAVEQHHDADGIRWPVAIAPYTVIIVIASSQDPVQVALAEELYSRLLKAGIDVLLDDRPERAGVKFKDADLIGIPWRLVVGRGAGQRTVELVDRSGDTGKRELSADAALEHLLGLPGASP